MILKNILLQSCKALSARKSLMKVGNVQFIVTEFDVPVTGPGMYETYTAALFHLLYFFSSIMLNSEH